MSIYKKTLECSTKKVSILFLYKELNVCAVKGKFCAWRLTTGFIRFSFMKVSWRDAARALCISDDIITVHWALLGSSIVENLFLKVYCFSKFYCMSSRHAYFIYFLWTILNWNLFMKIWFRNDWIWTMTPNLYKKFLESILINLSWGIPYRSDFSLLCTTIDNSKPDFLKTHFIYWHCKFLLATKSIHGLNETENLPNINV